MRWTVFIVVGLLAVVVETSDLTARVLTLHRLGHVYPSTVGVLVVFIALFAPRQAALWAAWILGVLMDLAPREQGILIGPNALGYVFATYFVLQVRTMVFRQRLLTAALLTVICLSAAGVVEVAVLTVRSWFADAGSPSADVRPVIEFLRRLGIAACSGILAIPLGWLLLQTAPLWGFEHAAERRRTWR
ncbi:MAG: rod shape-determining protein MreD [Planctomycetota bacterium]|jgi:rod shape-determining protein MreD